MSLKMAIQLIHDELHHILKEENPNLDALTIVTLNDKPSGQMVTAPPDWPDEKIAQRLEACAAGIRSREMIERPNP